jgi:hypothetical protein
VGISYIDDHSIGTALGIDHEYVGDKAAYVSGKSAAGLGLGRGVCNFKPDSKCSTLWNMGYSYGERYL